MNAWLVARRFLPKFQIAYPLRCRIPDVKPAGPIVRSSGIAILFSLLFPVWAVVPRASAQTPATSAIPATSKLPGNSAEPQPEFEAVSIHLVNPHSLEDLSQGRGLFSMSSFPTNLFTINNAPLAFLVQIAYDVDSQDHLSAMPSWMESQEYDVSAKVEGDRQLTLEQMRPLLRHLLEQRFHFAAHHESKVISGYALVIAKGGPKLQPCKEDGKPFAQILPNRMDGGHLDATHIAGVLGHRAGQPVVDKTGLKGNFDFHLSFAPADDPGSSLPNFFTAIQEQLGLKLESQKVPVDFLVIDHAEKIPTEN